MFLSSRMETSVLTETDDILDHLDKTYGQERIAGS